MRKFVILLMLLLVPIYVGAQPIKVKAVASFSILGDIVSQVGGDYIDSVVLVGPDGDAHTFEPTPKESIALSKAEVIFENGLHFEHFLDDLYTASGSKAKRVVVSKGIKVRTFDSFGEIGEEDPHVWQNVRNIVIMVKNIKEALIELDPAHQDVYEANASKYIAELELTDAWIKEQVNLIPSENRKLVTSHDAIGYYADAYGFKVIGAVIPSATTEAEDPSAQQTAALLDTIKSAGIKAIFTENIHNAKLAKAIAEDAKVTVAPGLFTDALGEAGSVADSYIKMMRYNTTTIVEALK